ncbi:PAS domain S-box protein [uncultured Methanoregula sp.]|uniref:PAS domain-containing sensor histidine kinase n=1 Tax=uncultured Methanoregula sp. TaxID=1005933 RepID=UPI002AAAA07A|nr:PAS domain S-box protein [uncultured Methanoregula sp.]
MVQQPGIRKNDPSADHSANSFFQTIFDNVQTGLVIIDPATHRIVDANSAALQMIGTGKKNIVGEVCHRFICPAEHGRCPITDLKQTIDRSERILLQSGGTRIPIIKSAGFISLDGREYLLENFFDNSERIRADAAAAETRRILRVVFDQTFQFIGLMTPDGTLIDANRSALKFSGISESDVIGKPFWETPWWTHSRELQEELQQGIRSASAGNFVRFEATHKAADGTLHYIDFSLKPVCDDDGKVIFLIPEGRDITDRKNIEDTLQRKNMDLYAAYEQLTATEEELRQNYEELVKKEKELIDRENKIRAMFEQTFQFVDLLTKDGILIDTNRPLSAFDVQELSDLSDVPYYATSLWSYSEDLRKRIHDAVLSAAEGKFTRYEIMDAAKDGSLRYTDFSIKPVKNPEGSIIYLIAESRDITNLITTSQALAESENIYRAIFGNTGTAMALVEEDTTIILVNTEFEHLSGYSRKEVEGRMSWTPFVEEEDLRKMLEQHSTRKDEAKRTPAQYEFRFITKSGARRDIFLTVDMIPGTTKSVASLMDITGSKQLTRELSATLREKEILLREIHHRVKNNLQIIISLLNLQSRNFSDPKVLGDIRECQNRVRAMALVHEKIYQSENLAEINITEYIRFLARYLVQFYGVDTEIIRLTIRGEDIRIGINTAVPLGLIINELISNALKHAFPKGRAGEIEISLEKTDSEIVIVLRDNGVGFPKNFDWRKSETLGLMLVESLIGQILGTLETDTTRGTEYRIKIPAKRIDCDSL